MRHPFNSVAGLLILLAGILITGCQPFTAGYKFNGTQLDPPWTLPDFELTDTQNQPFRLSGLDGDLALIYFGYTHCPDVCPLTLLDVKEALTGLENSHRVKVILITVDPDRDTPMVLDSYLNAFDPDFIGLTGDSRTLADVIKPFRVVAEKEELEGSATGYLVNHTARLYLVNTKPEVLLTYGFGFDPADLRSDLQYLLQKTDN